MKYVFSIVAQPNAVMQMPVPEIPQPQSTQQPTVNAEGASSTTDGATNSASTSNSVRFNNADELPAGYLYA